MLARLFLAALACTGSALGFTLCNVTLTTQETAALSTSLNTTGAPTSYGFTVTSLKPTFFSVLQRDTDASQFVAVKLTGAGQCIVYVAAASGAGAPLVTIWSATGITCTINNLSIASNSVNITSVYTIEVKKAPGYSCTWNNGVPGCPSTYETPIVDGLFRPVSVNQAIPFSRACSSLDSRKNALISSLNNLTWTSESDSAAAYVQLNFSGAFSASNVLDAVRKAVPWVATELPLYAIENDTVFTLSGTTSVQSIISRSNPSFGTPLGYLLRDGGIPSMFSYKSSNNGAEIHSFILARVTTCSGSLGPQYYGFRVVKIET